MPLYLEIPKEILRGLVTWGQGFTLKYYSKNKEGRKNEVSICNKILGSWIWEQIYGVIIALLCILEHV